MDKKILNELFDKFKEEQKLKIENYKEFCNGCKRKIKDIPEQYPAFISIGGSPVAGIGWGASELTKECQDRMKKNWIDKYEPRLNKLLDTVNEENVNELSELVNDDRGRLLNLFVNRCIITLHNTELLAIANAPDLELLIELLIKLDVDISYEKCNNRNMEWYNNNRRIFSKLNEILGAASVDKEALSCFGWYLKENLLRIMSLEKTLENCYNIILTGAPGTGKTYMAKEIAKQMDAEVEFTQFHPSYDYTDFVEGLRPKKIGRRILFERENGIFKDFCKKAVESFLKNEKTKYVMIIDEINRGEISKIFGELFFAIDPDYRVKRNQISGNAISKSVKSFAVQTQYQKLIPENSDDYFRYGFFVPDNVYIIGTMNDIDRSVESLDFAMRRRFTFVEFFASERLGMLEKITDNSTKELAKKKMEALNNAIVNPKVGNLSSAYQVGGAYFVNINHFANSDDKWEVLWDYHLKGLLYEYYRGQPDADRIVGLLKNAYDNVK